MSWNAAPIPAGNVTASEKVTTNVVTIDRKGNVLQENRTLIGCKECFTGLGTAYSSTLPGHKGSSNLFVQMVHKDGTTKLFGPAIKQ